MSRDTKPPCFWDWLGPFVLMAVFIAYLFLSTPSEIVLCRGEQNCFREWLGALSGWFAGVAAFATITLLWRQLLAQQRQTDYSVGDAVPFMQIHELAHQLNGCKIRVTNWNRYAVVLERVSLITPFPVEWWHELKDENGKRAYRIGEKGILGPRPWIAGWEDRNQAPPNLTFELIFMIDEDKRRELGIISFDHACEIELFGFINGPVRKPIRMCVSAPLRELEAFLGI